MKNFSLVFAISTLFFAVSCDSGIKFDNPNDKNSDAYQGDRDQETSDNDTGDTIEPDTDTSSSDITDNDIDNTDTTDTQDDDSDTSKPDTDNPDTTPDDGDPEQEETTTDDANTSAPNNGDDDTETDDNTDTSDSTPDNDSDTDQGRKQGELYGECYPNDTCNAGLICDVENNICIKDTDNTSDDSDYDTPDVDADTSTEMPDQDHDPIPENSCNSNSDCSGATPYCSITTSECIANAVFITEYVEGSSENKAIEIYNGSKSSVNLSNFTIQQAKNGSSFGSDANYIYNFPASSLLAPGATYVVCNDSAEDSLLSHCDDKPSTGLTLKFNGDDGMALFEGTLKVDQIGIQGDTAPWSVAGVSNATANHTLRRKTTVIQGTIDWDASAGTTNENSEWIVLDNDTFDGLGIR